MTMFTVESGKAANIHETAPRRSIEAKDGLYYRPKGMECSTVYEFAIERFNQLAERNALGWRDVIDIHKETKSIKRKINGEFKNVDKTWLFYELSSYKYTTYSELIDVMHHIGAGLREIGLTHDNDDKLHIYASTSHKWMKMYLGAQAQAIPVVTAYDTLGESGLIHSIAQTESKAIFTDNALLHTLINPVQKCNSVKAIIHADFVTEKDKRQGGELYANAKNAIDEIKKVRPDIKFYSFDELIEIGQKSKDIKPILPTPDDLSCIMYTSGSTGDPKGVVLKHSTIVAAVGGIGINTSFIQEGERLIAFLPLAHIFELAFELITLLAGGTLGYATVKTLTNASVRNCKGDMAEYKPHVMVGVAAVWENIKKGIIAQINSLSPLQQKVFWAAYYAKLTMSNYHIPGSNILGNLIFKKIKQATGGHLKYMLNGGGPLSLDTQVFISNLICPMLIGYGLTETVATGTVLKPANFEFGVAGNLVCCLDCKLVDVEELGYLAKNDQGEVLLKGPSITPEYYKNKEETDAAFTEDGWFRTGDIGQWMPNGHLKIIDRKKNLVKTLNGEYIALEKLESIYRSNKYIANICVYADITKVKPIGIIVPNLTNLKPLAIELGLSKTGDDIDQLIHNKDLIYGAFNDILKTGKEQGLVGIELLQGIVFVDEEWTPQNGYVTSAQKLKRKDILKAVQKDVDEVYASSS
ncbi:hypothetical protein Kpol_480p27 [Vanderwaltozyma polyspora DSM 70294]|uniref:AMP-dependent synthetase/ligase domain-containing protein n=1 Tax=Vanderwaltozyma polyspora (strain ATCC 22028 / DSM 70294 / BCRC 21397 / CBS 2163 / NBRC 10782 / NRRL Y-8283 / UCD 57-17) TaxID=436907 RepID=A7TP89_VANPO|nr:uncharacterized protein Kpol_480p27 [Vanderwaltozyma polyspora DSM 70294]EDO15940.1 hypothetical protein Kpol_480p27 [Vanderwaltozyma polyspora DSM 70294]